MNDIGLRLRQIRIDKGLTQDQLAQQLGCSSKAISCYENNKNLDKVYDFQKICEYLDADINYLMTGKEHSSGKEITEQEKQILSAYRELSDSDRRIVDYILNMEKKIQLSEPTIIYRFPVYEQQAAAGAGKHGREGKYYMKDLQIDKLSNQAVFGVDISGNSMEKKDDTDCGIKDNATVLLNPNFDELDLDGRVVVFKINSTNEVLCKRYFKEKNTIGFISDNDQCSDMDKHLIPGEYTIIGEVVNIINP